MNEMKLNRTGRRPLGFIGKEIYRGNTKDRNSVRWNVLRLFKTQAGFVMGIGRITCMEGETDFFQIKKFNKEKTLLGYVSDRFPSLEQEIRSVLESQVKYESPVNGEHVHLHP